MRPESKTGVIGVRDIVAKHNEQDGKPSQAVEFGEMCSSFALRRCRRSAGFRGFCQGHLGAIILPSLQFRVFANGVADCGAPFV
jgi:hypothetical protein